MSREARATRVPALVLGGGLNGLGVARSLGAEGIRVYLADTDTRRFELRTRYARGLSLSALEGDALLSDLIELGRGRFAGQRPVLVLTQERTVRTVAGALTALQAHFRFVLPAGGVLETLMHKQGFAQLARQTGLRIPATVNVRGAGDIDAALALTPPFVVKPSIHALPYERQFRKAYRVETPEAARPLIERILEVLPDVVVQEWIPGDDSDIFFCLQHVSPEGRSDASFVGRKIRSWPPNVGGTASCMSAPEQSADLAAATTEFFRRVGLCGLASLEYKRHAVTGEFVAIEPTVGRTDYQEEVATLNGANLPYAYYCDALGETRPVRSAASDLDRRAVWRDRTSDLQSMAHPDQTVRGWPAGHGPICDALWRREDPGPWLSAQWQRAARKSGGIWRRLMAGRGASWQAH